MGVTSSVSLETTKTVEKSVVDETVDGYESVYSCYFNEADQGGGEVADPEPDPQIGETSVNPKDCT
jgi:hypothetical protein